MSNKPKLRETNMWLVAYSTGSAFWPVAGTAAYTKRDAINLFMDGVDKYTWDQLHYPAGYYEVCKMRTMAR